MSTTSDLHNLIIELRRGRAFVKQLGFDRSTRDDVCGVYCVADKERGAGHGGEICTGIF